MKLNMEMPIVKLASCDVYDFLRGEETAAEGEARARQVCEKSLAACRRNLADYGGDWWEARVKQEQASLDAGFRAMPWEEFEAMQREFLLSVPLYEITEADYMDALNALPPVLWTNRHNVEMFCCREAYTGTYRTQYAHNLVTDKYYCKLVDGADRTTWISEILEQMPAV